MSLSSLRTTTSSSKLINILLKRIHQLNNPIRLRLKPINPLLQHQDRSLNPSLLFKKFDLFGDQGVDGAFHGVEAGEDKLAEFGFDGGGSGFGETDYEVVV